MRTEAQKIQDELTKKGIKRAREESGELLRGVALR